MTRAIRKAFNLRAAELGRSLGVEFELETLFGFNPVQAFGRLKGFPFWFHARSNCWTVYIHRNVDGDPCSIKGPKDGSKYQENFGEADEYAAGRMTDDEVFTALESAIKHFKKHGFPVES
jgi:hypothetical protein